jgi:cyclophilin family peptidyl-prolyl cis-trans isomerase
MHHTHPRLSLFMSLAIALLASSVQAQPDSAPAAESKSDGLTRRSMDNPLVLLKTSKGEIAVELFLKEAPLSTANFLKYVDEGHYDGTIFHRVMGNFMIQGGGQTADMKPKETHEPIKNEAHNGESNKRGTLAMARTGVVDSATSQFFVNVVDNARLDHRDTTKRGYGYTVFGQVIRGMAVVDAIKAVKTGTVGHQANVPLEAIVIEAAQRLVVK